MCSYFSKSGDKYSFSIKQAAQEAFDAKLDQFNTKKKFTRRSSKSASDWRTTKFFTRQYQVLEPLTKNNIWCLVCYISGLETIKRIFLQKKIFKLTQFMYFCLVVGANGSITLSKIYIKLYQKNYFIILKSQINHVFSFWVQ